MSIVIIFFKNLSRDIAVFMYYFVGVICMFTAILSPIFAFLSLDSYFSGNIFPATGEPVPLWPTYAFSLLACAFYGYTVIWPHIKERIKEAKRVEIEKN
ncbi:MAG: hypothetical protein V3R67_08835 [Thermodesulfobacteriota bacterium]